MVTERNINRPYPPPSNLISILHRLRSVNLPERIDSEYLRDAGIPEGTITRTLFALRFLNLVNEADEASQELRSIATSTDEEYQTILSGLIRAAYKEVFAVVDPAQDTQDKILNVFRRYNPASQRARMVIFFLGMCREAGIPTLDVPRARSMEKARPSKSLLKTTPKTTPTTQKERGVGRPPTIGIAPALDGLIRSLPSPGTPLSQERREQWIEMARATLKFVYPKEEEKEESAEEVEPEDSPS